MTMTDEEEYDKVIELAGVLGRHIRESPDKDDNKDTFLSSCVPPGSERLFPQSHLTRFPFPASDRDSNRLVGGVQYSKESQTIVVIMLHPGYFAYLPAAQRHLYPVYLLQQELYYMARDEVLTSNSSPDEIVKGKSLQSSRLVDRVVHRRTVGILHSYSQQMER
jgi:hypothetical protein